MREERQASEFYVIAPGCRLEDPHDDYHSYQRRHPVAA